MTRSILDMADADAERASLEALWSKRRRAPRKTSARDRLLAAIRVASYHDDSREAIRLRIEKRVSYEVWKRELEAGRQARRNGVRCTCFECVGAKQ